jgi:hypothetical protein
MLAKHLIEILKRECSPNDHVAVSIFTRSDANDVLAETLTDDQWEDIVDSYGDDSCNELRVLWDNWQIFHETKSEA